MLNDLIIRAARRQLFTLDVVSQIVGVPGRLISSIVVPVGKVNDVDVYRLGKVVSAFNTEQGARLLRKLHQNQLEFYVDCTVVWRDSLGTLHTAQGAVVEIRGWRVEVTLRDGFRVIRSRADPDLKFSGTPV